MLKEQCVGNEPFKFQTIWKSNKDWPFKIRNCPDFRSPLYTHLFKTVFPNQGEFLEDKKWTHPILTLEKISFILEWKSLGHSDLESSLVDI